MRPLRTRLVGSAMAAAFAATLLTTGATFAAQPSAGMTCSGGTIPAGTYSSLTVAGPCAVDAGNVTVSGNVKVLGTGTLLVAFGGSDLTVGGNLVIDAGGTGVLGCEPEAFTCFNDPDQNVGTLSAHVGIGGNLVSDGGLAILVHNASVGRNVVVDGGGGGLTCAPQLLGVAPAYGTFEDVHIAGNASITGFTSCWLGFFRNHVGRNVNFNDNVVLDPDGNEVATNWIGGNLNCSGNSPAPQTGDSHGNLNTVGGKATGQCVSLVN